MFNFYLENSDLEVIFQLENGTTKSTGQKEKKTVNSNQSDKEPVEDAVIKK